MYKYQTIINVIVLSIVLIICDIDANTEQILTMKWLSDWQSMQQDKSLVPSLRSAKVLLPGRFDKMGKIITCQLQLLGDDNRSVGTLLISADGTRIMYFHSFSNYTEGVTNPISAQQAKLIADEFVKHYYHNEEMIPRIEVFPNIDQSGCYEIDYNYYAKDICIYRISITVSYLGLVTDLMTGDQIYCNQENLNNFPPSPGRKFVLDQMDAYLNTVNIKAIDMENIERQFGYRVDKYIMQWDADTIYFLNGKKMRRKITYNEDVQKCYFSEDKPELYEQRNGIPITTFLQDSHPVWSSNRKSLYWQSNARWKLLPPWIQVVPNSIAAMTLTVPERYIYRPLPDIGQLSTTYTFPSPSADGKWLAVVHGNRNLLFIDLENNTLYMMDSDCLAHQRANWANDSSAVVSVPFGEQYILYQQVSSPTGIPFDLKPAKIHLDKICSAAEFLPGSKDTLLAILDQTNIVLIHYLPGKSAEIVPFITVPLTVQHMHVMPDGKSFIILDVKGKFTKIDIATKNHHELTWMSAKLPDGNSVLAGTRDWAVSPDGKMIAFSAAGDKDHFEYIYTAAIDGTGIKRITKGDPQELYDRYRVKGDTIVSQRNLTVNVMQQLGFLPDIEWHTPYDVPPPADE